MLVVCFPGIDVSCECESEQHCSAAAASECVFALEHAWEAGHRLASSPAEGTGEQATRRVDVPGEAHNGIFEQQVAAASLTAAWQHTPVLTARCVGSPLDKWEKDNPVSRIFVRDLMGKSVSLRVPSQVAGDELSLAVSVATGVPLEFFYLTIEGHILGGQDLLVSFGALPGVHIRKKEKLRGGVRPPCEFIPGQWTCGVCGMEGCWQARTKCYRCAAPGLEHLPAGFSLMDHSESGPILANLLLPSQFR